MLLSKPNPRSNKEIERRFLLRGLPPEEILILGSPCRYITLYLYTDNPEVRLRAVLSMPENIPLEHTMTVKFGEGLIRDEFISEIEPDLFREVLHSGKHWPAILKVRYRIRATGVIWEVDRFEAGTLDGLCMAEAELKTPDQLLVFPPWLKIGKEVTDDPRYSNKNLAVHGLPDPR